VSPRKMSRPGSGEQRTEGYARSGAEREGGKGGPMARGTNAQRLTSRRTGGQGIDAGGAKAKKWSKTDDDGRGLGRDCRLSADNVRKRWDQV